MSAASFSRRFSRTLKAAVAAADTTQAKQAAATEASKAMAEKVHAKTLALYECLMGKK